MKMCLKLLCTVAMTLWFGLAVAQQMEVIALKSKSVEDVLPVLLPLVEPGGTLTGMNNQLFLKASPRNRADIKRALAAIDTPTRRLVIRVSQNRESEHSARGGEVSGQVVLGGTRRSNVGATVWDSRSGRDERAGQMVQTIEGGQAFIQVGRSLAIPMRQVTVGPGGTIVTDAVVYQDVSRGFYAAPRLNGERVTLDISQQADSANINGRGNIDRQRISTTVSGRLGEWIELGGTGKQASGGQDGTFSRSTGDVRDNRSIWLMVEEVQ